MKKKMLPIIITVIMMIVLLIGVTYGAVYLGKIPVSLPFMQAQAIEYEPVQGHNIAEQWENVKIYKMKPIPENIQDMIDKAEVEKKEIEDIVTQLKYVEPHSFNEYTKAHPEVTENGPEKVFIDKVEKKNAATGIKSIHGDDVLAIDVVNGITIIGFNINQGDTVAQGKLAIVDNKEQMDMSIVDDLKYWDPIETHVKREKALLGVNANGYVWNNTGEWAVMYGAAKWHGNLARKADVAENTTCFAEDGTMTIGTDIEKAYNAVEYSPVLVKEGQRVYDASTDKEKDVRMAQTAIGQTKDGATLILAVNGGIYGSNSGATYGEVLDIMEKYGAYNATMLSGGSRSVMYWNGRVVTENQGYKETGVKIPTAVVVTAAPIKTVEVPTEDKAKGTETTETTETPEVADKVETESGAAPVEETKPAADNQ